jgi:hypothetical protein
MSISSSWVALLQIEAKIMSHGEAVNIVTGGTL